MYSRLTNHQVEQFLSEGYTVAENFFDSNEMRAMQCEVARWIEASLFRDVSTSPEKIQNFQLIPLHPHSELFKALPFAPKVIDAVSSLIGQPVVKILDQAFYKPPHSGMGTSWHTDNAYFKLNDPLRGLGMWIAIHDATKTNGTFKVVPSAFRKALPHTRDPASDHHIHTKIDDSNAVHCEMDAGGVVFFCFGTPHATGDNTTASGRVGAGFHFVNEKSMNSLQQERWQKIRLPGSQPKPSFDQLVKQTLSTQDLNLN